MSCAVTPPVVRHGHHPRDPTGTALYRLVAAHQATFVEVTQETGGAPSFVAAAFERYLKCGVLAHGFARFQCGDCHHDHLVALSCKARGLCPSCGGRRMATLARHIMDAELPYVPVRQWVLSLPHPLRYRLAYDQTLCTAVHRILAAALRQRMRRLARARGHLDAQTGSVTFVQRYGGGLNLNLHFHLLSIDGWFHRVASGELRFQSSPVPAQHEVEALVLHVQAKVMRLLDRQGRLDVDTVEDPLATDAPALSACYEGAVTQRVAFGPRRGRPVMKLGQPLHAYLASAPDRLQHAGLLCAHVDGFDLHGRVACGAAQRARIEQLVRYCARPPLSHDRLTKEPGGHYLLRLKTRWRDGTTHLRFEPIELMERLAAQIPRPRINLVLYAGVLAPRAKLRPEVVDYGRPASVHTQPATETLTRAERETWAELMRISFGHDMLHCPRCGGRLRHITTILDRSTIQQILKHLGLPARAPPCAPPSHPPPFWDDQHAA